MLQRIIEAQPRIVDHPFVFACGRYQVSHKRALDERLKAELGALKPLKPWVIHDLRRTKPSRPISGATCMTHPREGG
jgi:hypothetical protein